MIKIISVVLISTFSLGCTTFSYLGPANGSDEVWIALNQPLAFGGNKVLHCRPNKKASGKYDPRCIEASISQDDY